MKLKPLKYNLKLGLVALVPMMAACSTKDDITGVVVSKEFDSLYLDFNGDSVADVEIYVNPYTGREKTDLERRTEFLFNIAEPGDTVNLSAEKIIDNGQLRFSNQINTINGRNYAQWSQKAK